MPKEDIFQRIKDSLNYQYFIGQGTEAEVYKIKDTDYCVRIPYETKDLYSFNYTKDLTAADRLNHAEAKLGFGATIMKYIEGILPKTFINNDKHRYNLQSQAADMPIKSYSSLLHQIGVAIDNDMLFDFTGGNIIINPQKQELTAIDFIKMSPDYPRSTSPMNEMFNALTSYGTKHEIGLKIMKKILLTGLEEFKPNVKPCMDLELFDFVEFFENGNMRADEKIDTAPFNKYIEELKHIKKLELKDSKYAAQLESIIKKVEAEILKLR
jgi:hypothetical protein